MAAAEWSKYGRRRSRRTRRMRAGIRGAVVDDQRSSVITRSEPGSSRGKPGG